MEAFPLQNIQRRPSHQDQIRRVPPHTPDRRRCSGWSGADQDVAAVEMGEGIKEANATGGEDAEAPCPADAES